MDLADVAGYFDTTIASDAYNALATFPVQIEPLDMVKIDGAAVKRRVMSTTPDVVLPARQVIAIGTQHYLVGDGSPDHWFGEPIRVRYVLQGAEHLASVQTIAQVLANTAGTSAWVSIDFNKYGTDERDNSDYNPQYHIFFGGSEVVAENSVITAGGRTYLVRNAHKSVSGLVDALSNVIDDPVFDSVTLKARTYVVATDSFTEVPTTVRCLRVRWQDHFRYLTQGSTTHERGDMTLFLPAAQAVAAGDTVTLSDGLWRVLNVRSESGYKALLVRRA